MQPLDFSNQLFGQNQNGLWKKPINTVVVIDAGHGGLDARGRYTTAAIDGKFFDHKDKSLNFHGIKGNSIFYEGVFNRIMARKLAYNLAALGIQSVNCYDDVIDTPLSRRTALCNNLHRLYLNTIVVSLHANAGEGSGAEIFTSVGLTSSDKLAKSVELELLPSLSFYNRPNRGTKEANIAMVRDTAAPAILIEYDFFDTLGGAILLNTVSHQNSLSIGTARGIYKYLSALSFL